MKRLIIVLLIGILFGGGCVSMASKDAPAQNVISKPKEYCQQIPMEEIPTYDESECYKFSHKIIGIDVRGGRGEKGSFLGQLVDDRQWIASGIEYWIKMPNNRELSSVQHGAWDLLYLELPVDLCIKRQGTELSKETTRYGGSDRPVIEVIEMKKIDKQKVKKILDKQYAECQSQYNNMLEKWTTESSVRNFCDDVLIEWRDRDCQRPFTQECLNLLQPFAECYEKKLIKLNPGYINAIF